MKTKKQSEKNRTILLPLAMILALGAWSPVRAQSTEPAKGEQVMEHKMMECCQSTKKMKGEMEADLKTQVTELTAKISKMNHADEDKKLDLMAGIITQMVAQQKIMDVRQAELQKAMLVHMFMHVQMGKESMENCPMMEANGPDEKSPDASGGKPAEKE